MIAGAFDRRRPRALEILGVGSALAFGAADVIFSLRGRISKVYLGEAAAEGTLAAAWACDRRSRIAGLW